jgi:hypothetical protein
VYFVLLALFLAFLAEQRPETEYGEFIIHLAVDIFTTGLDEEEINSDSVRMEK